MTNLIVGAIVVTTTNWVDVGIFQHTNGNTYIAQEGQVTTITYGPKLYRHIQKKQTSRFNQEPPMPVHVPMLNGKWIILTNEDGSIQGTPKKP